MSKARDKALEAFPISFSERMGYKSANLPNERRNAFEKGYEQASKDAIEWLKEHINDYIINDKQHPNSKDWLKVKSDAFEDFKKYMTE